MGQLRQMGTIMADANILDIIAEHAAQGQTGTIMAVFEDNSIGRFYMVGGIPATARYRNRQGQAALDLAAGTAVTTSNFHVEADLVRSSELLNGSALPANRSSAASVGVSRPVGVPVTPGRPLSGPLREQLEELLSEFIGPVAPLLVADLPPDVSVNEAIQQLSAEISDPAQTAQFVRTAREHLA